MAGDYRGVLPLLISDKGKREREGLVSHQPVGKRSRVGDQQAVIGSRPVYIEQYQFMAVRGQSLEQSVHHGISGDGSVNGRFEYQDRRQNLLWSFSLFSL